MAPLLLALKTLLQADKQAGGVLTLARWESCTSINEDACILRRASTTVPPKITDHTSQALCECAVPPDCAPPQESHVVGVLMNLQPPEGKKGCKACMQLKSAHLQ